MPISLFSTGCHWPVHSQISSLVLLFLCECLSYTLTGTACTPIAARKSIATNHLSWGLQYGRKQSIVVSYCSGLGSLKYSHVPCVCWRMAYSRSWALAAQLLVVAMVLLLCVLLLCVLLCVLLYSRPVTTSIVRRDEGYVAENKKMGRPLSPSLKLLFAK